MLPRFLTLVLVGLLCAGNCRAEETDPPAESGTFFPLHKEQSAPAAATTTDAKPGAHFMPLTKTQFLPLPPRSVQVITPIHPTRDHNGKPPEKASAVTPSTSVDMSEENAKQILSLFDATL